MRLPYRRTKRITLWIPNSTSIKCCPEVPTVKETANIPPNYVINNKVTKWSLRSVATPTIDPIHTIEDESLVPPEDLLTWIERSITLISSIKLKYKINKIFSTIVKIIDQYPIYYQQK
jgi:hypothetical protein